MQSLFVQYLFKHILQSYLPEETKEAFPVLFYHYLHLSERFITTMLLITACLRRQFSRSGNQELELPQK